MAKLEKLYELIDKDNFEPGGTLEERVSVLEEVLQEQVMAVSTTNEDEGATDTVTLYNVIDTRTGKFHSEVRVQQRMVRFFVPAEEEEDVIES